MELRVATAAFLACRVTIVKKISPRLCPLAALRLESHLFEQILYVHILEIELGGRWPSTENAECYLAINSEEGFSSTFKLGTGLLT